MAAKKEAGQAAPKQIREYDAETMQKIQTLAAALLEEINKGENLHIDIPVRGSSNVTFNEKTKKIELGDKFARRYLFNVAHARRFMQTLLVASYVKKDLLENNLTATLRDLYYAKKHTIPGTKEDTIDEQKKLGGEPEKCMIFELYKQHLIDDDKQLQKIYDDCKAGKLMCGEDKQHACELMTKFMEKFEKDMEKARKKVKELKFVEFK